MSLFKPNLASQVGDINDLIFPLLGSPKIDGVRAMVHDQLMSRSMKPIPNEYLQAVFGAFDDLRGLDGELVVGSPTDPNCMQNTTSGVMSRGKIPEFQYHVFDKFDDPSEFTVRYRHAAECVAEVAADWTRRAAVIRLGGGPMISCPLVLVPQVVIAGPDDLLVYEAEQLELGYEGIMVRRGDAMYKQGRSTAKEGGLLKVKRFVDSEAIIIGFEEEMENQNAKQVNELGRTKRSSHKAGKVGKNTLGAFVVRDVETNVVFNIGTGMDFKFRAWAWANRAKLEHQFLTYKSFPIGVKDAPRHPVFKSLREKWDMTS